MENITINRFAAYETDGTKHVIEIARSGYGSYYVVLVDGAFYADADNLSKAGDEVYDIIQWFGWVRRNPVFA